MFSFWLC
ncbi:hypothetical protein YPPY53_2259, partial [Yersinia pestis PY-53]